MKIKMVAIDKITTNPYRDLETYPVVRSKVESLKSSFATVGVWPSIIGREMPNGQIQQAFGHQRVHAAKELKLKEVPVIVMALTDEQMVQYMGRENGEDYSADFLVLLNTWEAGIKFAHERNNLKTVDVARLLGWTRLNPSSGYDKMSQVARACAGASSLIEQGYLSRDDLKDLSVRTAKDIVERALSRMESIDQSAKLSGAKAKDVDHAKSMVGKGVKATASEVRGGTVPASKVASRVDVNTLTAAGRAKGKVTPLFAMFGRALIDNIAKLLKSDSISDKLAEITKVIDQVVDEDDRIVLRQLDFELTEVSARAERWRKRLTPNKVKPFTAPARIGGPE